MESRYLILVIVFIACFFVRTGYEILKDAGKINPGNKWIFTSIFSVMCIIWICWFELCSLDPFRIDMAEVVRWIGFAVFGVGMLLAIGAFLQLRGLENIEHLVTSGLFTRIRHPMYTGFILWILGWSTYHGAIVSLAFGLAGIVNILYWRWLEERRLLTEYGDTYMEYRLTTWF